MSDLDLLEPNATVAPDDPTTTATPTTTGAASPTDTPSNTAAPPASPKPPEPWLTIEDAARRLNLPARELRLAVKNSEIPTRRLRSSWILVRLSEVEKALMLSSKAGGVQ